MDVVKEAAEAEKMCGTCGETCDPDFTWNHYEPYGWVFCSEDCMRDFEELGK